MKTRYLKVDLSSTEDEVKLHIRITRDCYIKRGMEYGVLYDPNYVWYQESADVFYLVLEAKSFLGLAGGIRVNLTRILSALEKNQFCSPQYENIANRNFVKPEDRAWFSTGNDYKLVQEFLDFITSVKFAR